MPKTFIIAEAACTWTHGGLESAYASIEAAKKCGADAWKTQWTSDPEAMAMRRGVDRDKYKRLGWAGDALPLLKAHCDKVGIEFMVTTFIAKDIALVAPYVSRFKVSAFEGKDYEFIKAHGPFGKPLIRSLSEASLESGRAWWDYTRSPLHTLHCVSKYPTDARELSLDTLTRLKYDGLSDHTTSLLTGAVAVGAGARILEKHVRMIDTPEDDPDFGHSLLMEMRDCEFSRYVDFVREAERMM